MYYWLNMMDIEPGAIINPGTWWRVKRTSFATNDMWFVLETIYEEVRSKEFPDMPSRQQSLFVFSDKLKAIEYQKAQRMADLLYEVEIVNPGVKHAQLDMNIVRTDFPVPIQYIEQARAYWASVTNDNQTLPEIVIEGQIKVVRKIDAG